MQGQPPSGSGIGLALVQGLAQRLGGSCEISSDGGTRCVVTVIDRQPTDAMARLSEEERLADGAP
jgi:signal transduction histidine kinase